MPSTLSSPESRSDPTVPASSNQQNAKPSVTNDLEKRRQPGAARRTVDEIYGKPLPRQAFPLPTFHPSNPLTFAPLLIEWAKLYWNTAVQAKTVVHNVFWSPETLSFHVRDAPSIRALWEQGFFGKGHLSRSEPNWFKAEEVRRGLRNVHVSELNTQERREKRKQMKWERARLEQEAIQSVRIREFKEQFQSNYVPHSPMHLLQLPLSEKEYQEELQTSLAAFLVKNEVLSDVVISSKASSMDDGENNLEDDDIEEEEVEEEDTRPIEDIEHLQLTLEETFFLSFGLGCVSALRPDGSEISQVELFTLCRQYSYAPPRTEDALLPDDKFLIHYALYHHFRSLGWVPRAGIKFGVDWLLYTRGPVFDHAEYGIIVVPSYPDGRLGGPQSPTSTWPWFHGVNRTLTHALKTLMLVYVQIPRREDFDLAMSRGGIKALLQLYTVREFIVRRWSSNRNR